MLLVSWKRFHLSSDCSPCHHLFLQVNVASPCCALFYMQSQHVSRKRTALVCAVLWYVNRIRKCCRKAGGFKCNMDAHRELWGNEKRKWKVVCLAWGHPSSSMATASLTAFLIMLNAVFSVRGRSCNASLFIPVLAISLNHFFPLWTRGRCHWVCYVFCRSNADITDASCAIVCEACKSAICEKGRWSKLILGVRPEWWTMLCKCWKSAAVGERFHFKIHPLTMLTSVRLLQHSSSLYPERWHDGQS